MRRSTWCCIAICAAFLAVCNSYAIQAPASLALDGLNVWVARIDGGALVKF